MTFKLRPILAEMKTLYSKPISKSRFSEYISKLQGGTKGDLALPITGFNPMAKDHILQKITELEALEAEKLMHSTIETFNLNLATSKDQIISVVLNLADDRKGGWTNYYSTDYESKFKLSAYVGRHFCVPYFWTSEAYTENLIRTRTIEYLSRTAHRMNNPQPKTLEQHFEQEKYVARHTAESFYENKEMDLESIATYYEDNKKSEDYDVIFNFFYGDTGSESLGYKKYGIIEKAGFNYAQLKRRK